jgi:hypothetical protein
VMKSRTLIQDSTTAMKLLLVKLLANPIRGHGGIVCYKLLKILILRYGSVSVIFVLQQIF